MPPSVVRVKVAVPAASPRAVSPPPVYVAVAIEDDPDVTLLMPSVQPDGDLDATRNVSSALGVRVTVSPTARLYSPALVSVMLEQ